MSRKNYYGVYAENGLGVYSNWEKLQDAQIYMRGERIQGFSDLMEAKDYAFDGFELLHGPGSAMCTLPNGDDFWMNFFHYWRRRGMF